MVDWKIKCPHCGEMITDFQTKDGACLMTTFKFWEVENFYSSCRKCGTWIEYNYKKPRRKLKISDYKKIVKIEHLKESIEKSKKFWKNIQKRK